MVESLRPMNNAGINAMKPAMGPAIPMSNNARRVGNAWRIRITAPSVPAIDGNGMKKGSVASTP